MNLKPLAAILIGALLGGAALAQAPQAPDAKPPAESPAATTPAQEQEAIMRGIVECLAEGLPQNWQKAWFVVSEIKRDATGKDREFEALFYFAMDAGDRKGQRLKTCGGEKVIEGVAALNSFLPESQRRWTGATFNFYRDGKFEASYDYTPRKPQAAQKKSTKKKQESK